LKPSKGPRTGARSGDRGDERSCLSRAVAGDLAPGRLAGGRDAAVQHVAGRRAPLASGAGPTSEAARRIYPRRKVRTTVSGDIASPDRACRRIDRGLEARGWCSAAALTAMSQSSSAAESFLLL
jgi:hypothetical protein